MASMLDELMGRDRNARPDEKRELYWDNDEVRIVLEGTRGRLLEASHEKSRTTI